MIKFRNTLWLLITQLFYSLQFKSIGKRSRICKPLQLDSVGSIVLGDFVFIAEGAWLMGNKSLPQTMMVKSGTVIGHFAHFIAMHSVIIEESVLIADKVFITDCTHKYKDISTPVVEQGISLLNEVIIGEGSWLGENVCVCGASIGKHCIIGANSVVLQDIPDYCVAAGSPARVVKKYDFEKKEWILTDSNT